MPLITRSSVSPTPPTEFTTLPELAHNELAHTHASSLDLPNDAEAEELVQYFDRISLIRIRFPDFSDGRGFSLAARLRELGYRGKLRAHGYIISDQFQLALGSGFDEIEIDDELASRHPAPNWRSAAGQGYRTRLANGRSPVGLQDPVA